MIMPPHVRKLVLTAHVISSVGWLGAVATFVGIAFIAWTSPDGQAVRAALLLMEPVAWYVIVPLSLTSLVSGISQGLFSTWGLIRHYWVLFKLVIGAVSTYVLLLFNLTTVVPVTSAATDPAMPVDELRAMAGTPRDHALLALAGLLTATALALYKPRGLTRYGLRKLERQRGAQRAKVTASVRATSTAATTHRHASEPASATSPLSETGADRGRSSTGRLPRWVKPAAFILGVLVWALLVRLFLGAGAGDGGGHGPGPGSEPPGVNQEREINPDDDGGHTPPPGIPDHGR